MERKPSRRPVIVVTRPRGQAAEMGRELKRLGARVILAPLIKTVPPASNTVLDKCLRNIDKFDSVVFTSANAVEHFFARARALGLKRLLPPKVLFAVGRRTAGTLAGHGWKRVRTAEEPRGEGLARLMGRVKGWRVLLPRAAAAREVLPGALRRRGAVVTVAAAYRTVADGSGVRRLKSIDSGRIDAVTFTSGSTVEQFVRALGAVRCRTLFSKAAAASIGPVTSAALRRHGIAPAVQAKGADTKSLCAKLIRYLRRRTSGRSPA